MLSTNFKIEDDKIIGIDENELYNFIRKFYNENKNSSKFFCLKIVEQTSSQRIQNYLHVIISSFSKESGIPKQELEVFFKNSCIESYKKNNTLINDNLFHNSVYDLFTGEEYQYQLKSISSMTNSELVNYIDFVKSIINEAFPDFIFPNPDDYHIPTKGQKNELTFPNLSIIMK